MEQLFIEVRDIKIKEFKSLSEFKEDLFEYMKIQKDKIEVEGDKIRTILLYMNRRCLIDMVEDICLVQKNGLELFKKKNKDYGESYKKCGIIGILVRIIDKINRLENLNKIDKYEVNDESYQDTLIDLHNYTLLGIMCIDN